MYLAHARNNFTCLNFIKAYNDEVELPDPLEVNKVHWSAEAEGIVKWPSLYYSDKYTCLVPNPISLVS